MDLIGEPDSFTHLIAGASRGIGKKLLNSCVKNGEQVFALSRTQPNPLPSGCDWITGNANEPENFANELPDVIHGLTFCPGKVILGPLKRLNAEQMLEAYQTSVVDAFTLIQALLPKLTDSSIVLISSVAAGIGLPNHCAISAAKAGLEGFALALAADLAPKVRVNVVAPTLTPTEMGLAMVGGEKMIPMIENRHPMKRIPAVNEITDTISFLHSPSAASITGQVLKVDGGLSRLRTS
jgi:3-oxoacyl-[acyl-carrier protein] reductase